MKKFSLFLLPMFVISQSLIAQKVSDSLRYAESIWSMEKRALILEKMDLTEAEKAAFWPVYESYSSAIQYLEMEYIRLLNIDEAHLSEKKAKAVTESLLMNEVLLAKTRKQYFRKFRKALSASQASAFMQIDNNFRTMLRLQMQKQPPTLLTITDRIYTRN